MTTYFMSEYIDSLIKHGVPFVGKEGSVPMEQVKVFLTARERYFGTAVLTEEMYESEIAHLPVELRNMSWLEGYDFIGDFTDALNASIVHYLDTYGPLFRQLQML